MCLARRLQVVSLIGSAALFSTSCASRVRPIARGTRPATQRLLTATKKELIQKIADSYESIQSFSTTVDLTPSLGSVYKGQIKDYTDITAYIDFRKPGFIHIAGLLPVVRTTAFNMVSDGTEFRVLLALKNRFIVGRNDAPGGSPNKLENIRPETFLSAMLVRPIDPQKDMTIMLDDTTETTASYQLGIVRKDADGELLISRRITFDRVNLQVVEQREYDAGGSIVSRSRYDDWHIYDNIRFPAHIEITRPKDEYGIVLLITKMDINKPVPNARFVLAQPEGSELQTIGLTSSTQPLENGKDPK